MFTFQISASSPSLSSYSLSFPGSLSSLSIAWFSLLRPSSSSSSSSLSLSILCSWFFPALALSSSFFLKKNLWKNSYAEKEKCNNSDKSNNKEKITSHEPDQQ